MITDFNNLNKYKTLNTGTNLSILKQPVLSVVNDHLIAYPVPSNLNYFWGFGSLAGISLVIQIATGVFLACHYTPDVNLAFSSVEHIMRDVQGGFLLRYMHANGASMFFVVTFAHMLRSLYYGSYQAPREAVWIVGVIILFLMIATAFMGGRTFALWLFEYIPFCDGMEWSLDGHVCLGEDDRVLHMHNCMWLRAFQRPRSAMARLTNPTTLSKAGERTPPSVKTAPIVYHSADRHPISTGTSRVSTIAGQGDQEIKKKSQSRELASLLKPTGQRKPTADTSTTDETEPKGNGEMPATQQEAGRSEGRVVALVVVHPMQTALCCEVPQPERFLGIALKAAQNIRNLDYKIFSCWELASAFAQIDLYSRMAQRDLGFLGKIDVHKILCNPSFLLYAYASTGNPRAAAGIDNVKPRGLTARGIHRLAKLIKDNTYHPLPSRRVMIPKAVKGKFRPLGIASSRDKVVQQALKLILEPIFEPTFLSVSHGFRPGRSCHTALKQIDQQWQNPTWLLEFDFAKAYDTLNHRVLMGLINRRFRDAKTASILWKMLKAGYVNPLALADSDLDIQEGTPQGSIISPLMANIYFDPLDKWIHEVLTPHFSDSGQGKVSTAYRNSVTRWKGNPWEGILRQVEAQTPNLKQTQRRELLKRLRAAEAKAANVPYTEKSLRKLLYVRYADDFLLGFRGSKADARCIRHMILNFIENQLRMRVNVEKTGIKHKSEGVMFLGYTIWLDKDVVVRNVAGEAQRRTRTGLKFTIPIKRLFQRYMDKGFFQRPSRGKTQRLVPRYQTKFVFMHPYDIIQRYNAIVRGLVGYYSGSERLSDLHKFIHELKRSAALTIAHYYGESSARKMFEKYSKNLEIVRGDAFVHTRRKVEFLHPNLTKRPAQLKWGSGDVNKIARLPVEGISLPKTMTVIRDVKELECCIPGCDQKAADWHHIKHQRKVGGGGIKRAITLQTAKQLPVCKKHHTLIHSGKYNGPSLRKMPAYEN